jgi:hypothetical protein
MLGAFEENLHPFGSLDGLLTNRPYLSRKHNRRSARPTLANLTKNAILFVIILLIKTVYGCHFTQIAILE